MQIETSRNKKPYDFSNEAIETIQVSLAERHITCLKESEKYRCFNGDQEMARAASYWHDQANKALSAVVELANAKAFYK